MMKGRQRENDVIPNLKYICFTPEFACKVTVLDEVGTLFWDSIVNNTSFAEFIISMQNMYDVEESVLKNDYIVFIEKLKDAGIIW